MASSTLAMPLTEAPGGGGGAPSVDRERKSRRALLPRSDFSSRSTDAASSKLAFRERVGVFTCGAGGAIGGRQRGARRQGGGGLQRGPRRPGGGAPTFGWSGRLPNV
jgi:hypothetical protein